MSAAFSVAVSAFAFSRGAGPGHGEITKSFTFPMPACPIEATTVPFTISEFKLPKKNPVGVTAAIAGTVQIADQTGSVVLKISAAAEADHTGLRFSRTVNTISHATAHVSFDRGCTSTDPYGSNNCSWTWGDSISAGYQGALQEDITSGKLVVDLKIDNTVPVSFSCPVCGAYCTIAVPKQIDDGKWDKVWHLMIRLIRLPLALTDSLSSN
jgi:hypothetical protein